MVKSIIEGVADFFKDCPLLNAGVFRVDALGDEPQEYTIETGIFNPIIETYIDGSSDRRYQFNFGSREYYSMDRLQNIANSTFYEDFANWVEASGRARQFSGAAGRYAPGTAQRALVWLYVRRVHEECTLPDPVRTHLSQGGIST